MLPEDSADLPNDPWNVIVLQKLQDTDGAGLNMTAIYTHNPW